ncbi:MAG: beta-ketoacyl-ACP synthase II [Dehalococcoidia bacterium]
MNRRVVVTGIGMVTPVGHNSRDSWQALTTGIPGIGPITLFDPEGQDSRIAGEVKEWEPGTYMERKAARRADRFTQFAFVAADEALGQAGYEIVEDKSDKVAVIVGTAIGGITTLSEEFQTMYEKGAGRVSPFLIPMMLPDMASGQLSIRLGTRGVNYALVSACASGADCIGEAANMILRGETEFALAGGSEAAITPITMAGFAAAKSLSTRNDCPEEASRPFDARRDGFVMGEGAAILALESVESATKRGARVLAEFGGYGATSDAFHVTQPDENGRGAAAAMTLAMERAGVRPEEVQYINAHGTSTQMNDALETKAIKRAFGESAGAIPISSTKSMTGHLLGAAGAMEAAICVLAIESGVIPPTINYREQDEACDLDYVPNVARAAALDTVMTNSLGFGGHNASLVLRRYRSDG